MTLRTFSNIKIRLFLHSQNTVKFRMMQNFLYALVEILQKKIYMKLDYIVKQGEGEGWVIKDSFSKHWASILPLLPTYAFLYTLKL